MTDELQRFQAALEAVPKILLDDNASKMLERSRDALMAMRFATANQTVVVIVGCSGVGKSYLFNAIAGSDISPSGVLRPTTKAALAAGRQLGMESLINITRIRLPDVPLGLIIIDTPPWDFDKAGVEEILCSADMAVLVVSPSRYGDSTTRDLWQAVAETDDVVLVVNRLPASAAARGEIVESVASLFGVSPIAVLEGDGTEQFVAEVVQRRPDDTDRDTKDAEIRVAAQRSGRTLATVLTARAADLVLLESAVKACTLSEHGPRGYAVEESWLATRQSLVDVVASEIESTDRDIVESSHTGIAQRVLTLLGQWDAGEVNNDLERWRREVADDFKARAVVRWRTSAAHQLLDQSSWEIATDPTHAVARRVTRMMKSNLAEAAQRGHKELIRVLGAQLDQRLAAWRSVIDEAGHFKPGELLVASDRLTIS